MRALIPTLAVALLLAACAQQNPGTPPPNNRFYYPTGIAFVPDATGDAGFIYVVSSDFDLRFNRGTIAAVDLSTLPIPSIEDAGATPLQIDDPHIASQVSIDVLSGPLAVYQRAGASATSRRLFVTGRQQDALDVVDVDGAKLTCPRDPTGLSTDCAETSIAIGKKVADTYRPVVYQGQVYVSGLSALDDPEGSDTNFTSSLARVNAETLDGPIIHPIGPGPVDGMVGVGNFVFLGARAEANITTIPLRAVDVNVFGQDDGGALAVDLSTVLDVRDTRSMALSTDRSRVYLVTRVPDALVTLDVTVGANGLPSNQVLGIAELPAGASEIDVISRGPGRGDVLAIPCATANFIALYDDELGRVIGAVRGMGNQPYAVTHGPRPGGGVRLYATSFGRGDIAVIDLPNLDDLSNAQVLLTLGPDQNCLNDSESARPPGCPQ